MKFTVPELTVNGNRLEKNLTDQGRRRRTILNIFIIH
jgi:hypothetical protein